MKTLNVNGLIRFLLLPPGSRLHSVFFLLLSGWSLRLLLLVLAFFLLQSSLCTEQIFLPSSSSVLLLLRYLFNFFFCHFRFRHLSSSPFSLFPFCHRISSVLIFFFLPFSILSQIYSAVFGSELN